MASRGKMGPMPALIPLPSLRSSEAPALTPAQRRRHAMGAVASLLLGAVIVGWLLPLALGTSWSQIGAVLGEVAPVWIVGLSAAAVAAALIDSAGFALCFRSLSWARGLRTNLAAHTVAAAVPFGSTLSLGVLWSGLRHGRLRAADITAGILLASSADLISHALIPALASAALVLAPESLGVLWRVLCVLVALALVAAAVGLVRVLGSDRLFTGLMGRVQGIYEAFSEGYGSNAKDLSASATAVRETALHGARGSLAVVFTLPTLARALQGVAFAAWCAWGLGLEASPLVLFAVYALGRLLTLIPLTPGGIGVADAGVAWALTLAGVPAAEALTATLVFTLTQTLVPAILGAASLPGTLAGTAAARAGR